ncbi:MAG: adenylate kinase family protein [Candidatus Micrarchaeia archaeon]
MILILTGTPGTGKDTIAAELAKKGWDWIPLNRIVEKHKLWKRKERGCKVADLNRLKREVLKEIIEFGKCRKRKEKNVMIEGHLACEMEIPADICIVLRASPRVLERRLKRRGYLQAKVDENLMCEILDYCTQKAEANLECPVYEVRSDKSLKKTMSDITAIITGSKMARNLRAGWVDWSGYLLRERSQRKRI